VGLFTYLSEQGMAWFFEGVQPPPFDTAGKDIPIQSDQVKAKANSSFPNG
jgi:hypothetical protein